MMLQDTTVTGRLVARDDGAPALVDDRGVDLLPDERIWGGYLAHWSGRRTSARRLPQRDYETGRPIVIMWPERTGERAPFAELYYNERLVKYPASRFGHVAINVNGGVFNFSHLINENEEMTEEEFLYRPPLGEFAPHPVTGLFDVADPVRPYYDKFGRNFMRTIHVLRIEGFDADRLAAHYRREIEVNRSNPDPARPEKYRDFSVVSRSCVTIIRDGLRAAGVPHVGGHFPRDLFISAAYHLTRPQTQSGLRVRLYRMPQLVVPEAPVSAPTPIINPANRFRALLLPKY